MTVQTNDYYLVEIVTWNNTVRTNDYNQMCILKKLQWNNILVLNNPWGVDMPLNK